MMSLSSKSPPPLPPRLSSDTPSQTSASFLSSPRYNVALHIGDPRNSSTQSLVPSISDSENRRKLLVIYIHGFYGNDQSFRSFPAHVHALLNTLVADSHVIHSKTYPRYKTYKAIEVARDNFSTWLEPHESPNTDVVLVGHSMGGLLAAEVILMPNRSPYHQHPYKHRILGTIAMDSPFLGLHPGIIVSGVASLFQPSPKLQNVEQDSHRTPPERLASPALDSTTSLEWLPSINPQAESVYTESSSPGPSSRQPTDPYFNPPYYNDVPFRQQPFVKRLLNFTSKHRHQGLFNAVGNHINSHLEFGGCLADYRGLNIRYNRLRALEDVDELKLMSDGHPAGAFARVRFVNYYTLSSGRPKLPKPDVEKVDEGLAADALPDADLPNVTEQINQQNNGEQANALDQISKHVDVQNSAQETPLGEAHSSSAIKSPDGSDGTNAGEYNPLADKKDHVSHHLEATTTTESGLDINRISLHDIEPVSLADDDTHNTQAPELLITEPSFDPDIPPIPEAPIKPTLPDMNDFIDKDAKKHAEKENKRLQRAYDQAIKDRNKAIQERDKLLQKRRKGALKQAKKKAQDEEIKRLRVNKEEKKCTKQEAAKQTSPSIDGAAQDTHGAEGKKKRRKFCSVPRKKNGVRDCTWIDVYMEDMDEVGAHCGLFFSGSHYNKLVGDVGTRIAGWVSDDLTKRSILDTT